MNDGYTGGANAYDFRLACSTTTLLYRGHGVDGWHMAYGLTLFLSGYSLEYTAFTV